MRTLSRIEKLGQDNPNDRNEIIFFFPPYALSLYTFVHFPHKRGKDEMCR